jgi:hypothetical protein
LIPAAADVLAPTENIYFVCSGFIAAPAAAGVTGSVSFFSYY